MEPEDAVSIEPVKIAKFGRRLPGRTDGKSFVQAPVLDVHKRHVPVDSKDSDALCGLRWNMNDKGGPLEDSRRRAEHARREAAQRRRAAA